MLGALTHYLLYSHGILHYRSLMAANSYLAIFAWPTCFVVTLILSFSTPAKKDEDLVGVVYQLTPVAQNQQRPWYEQPAIWAFAISGMVIILNIIFW
jgi:SSS family solute:Na+ symporter